MFLLYFNVDNSITYDDQELSYHIEQLNQSDSNDNNLTTICDVDSKYCEMEDMQYISPKNIKPKLTALHINMHSLPAKFDQLNLLLYKLKQANTYIHCILLCETFLNDNNSSLFPIPGYNFICKNRQNSTRGGIAIYIREEISYTVRGYLAVHIESEFESLIIEINIQRKKNIIGDIYRVPNTNEQLSIERYETLISKVNSLKIDTSGHRSKFRPAKNRPAQKYIPFVQLVYIIWIYSYNYEAY